VEEKDRRLEEKDQGLTIGHLLKRILQESKGKQQTVSRVHEVVRKLIGEKGYADELPCLQTILSSEIR
jgi:ABC-type uncharacterized transport system substrate-binding protein